MKLSLKQVFLCFSAIAAPVHAITLLQVLESYSELASLASYVNSSEQATALLANANNFTFLAPSNAAIAKFTGNNPNVLTQDLLEATHEYSLLKGGYPSLSFTETPQFVSSNLVNGTYANVTGGQVVQLISNSDGQNQVLTGNKSISISSTAVSPPLSMLTVAF